MEIKFNLFGYEFSVRVTSNDPLDRILSSLMKMTNEEERKSKIQMIKCVRTVAKANPEWFESLGWELVEHVDMHTGNVSKLMGLADSKEFVEAHFEFEKVKDYDWSV